jgi:hypothetical protein
MPPELRYRGVGNIRGQKRQRLSGGKPGSRHGDETMVMEYSHDTPTTPQK